MESTTRKPERLPKLDQIRVVGVARQSRGDDGSMSIDDQREALRVACERNGWHLTTVYVEQDVSGRRPLARRPGLRKAIEDVESGEAQVVLAAYFDRVVRSLAVQAEVMERIEAVDGASLRVLDAGEISSATAIGWLTATQLGAMAEFIARQTGEKTMASKQRNIDRGVPPFPRITPAYVRREDGTLEPHPVYGPLVAEACRMRVRGTSYTRLARFLRENGLEVTPNGVASMLASPLLVGEIHFGRFRPNLDAGRFWGGTIIDRATFRKMQAAKATRGRYGKSDRLLARLGVLRCGTCGRALVVHSSGGHTGDKKYPYYVCSDRLCEAPASVAAVSAEEWVKAETTRLLEEADVEGSATIEVEVETARVAADETQRALDEAIETLLGLGGERKAREVLDELTERRDEALARYEHLSSRASRDLTLRASDDLTPDEWRELIPAVVDRAVVTPGRGPGRVEVFPL